MGLDFVKSTAAVHKKARREAFDDASLDMFSSFHALPDRVFLAEIVGHPIVEEQQLVLIRLVEDRVCVFEGVVEIAEIEQPSPELRDQLNSCYGLIQGQIEEINDLSNTFSIRVGGSKP